LKVLRAHNYQTTESEMNVMNILIDFLSSSVFVREDERKTLRD
jgi:hypothetical protein